MTTRMIQTPTTPLTEEQLTDWLVDFITELLDIRADEVGTDIPFGFLGVDSATTLVLISDLTSRTGRDVRPAEVFAHPTIAELAAHLAGSGTADTATAPAGTPSPAGSAEGAA